MTNLEKSKTKRIAMCYLFLRYQHSEGISTKLAELANLEEISLVIPVENYMEQKKYTTQDKISQLQLFEQWPPQLHQYYLEIECFAPFKSTGLVSKSVDKHGFLRSFGHLAKFVYGWRPLPLTANMSSCLEHRRK